MASVPPYPDAQKAALGDPDNTYPSSHPSHPYSTRTSTIRVSSTNPPYTCHCCTYLSYGHPTSGTSTEAIGASTKTILKSTETIGTKPKLDPEPYPSPPAYSDVVATTGDVAHQGSSRDAVKFLSRDENEWDEKAKVDVEMQCQKQRRELSAKQKFEFIISFLATVLLVAFLSTRDAWELLGL